MSLQNRVNPFGEICFSGSRGNLMGNRGCLHKERQIIRLYQLKRWIICVLSYKERKRELMTPGQYTELFFWDEATALAAGHRPCAQCQYARYKQFTNLWRIANLEPEAGIETIDEYLHKERLNDEKPYFKIEDLPDGAFVSINEKPFLVYENQLYAWDFDGYTNTFRPPQDISFKTLTPLSIIKTIQSGYRPEVVFKK